MLGFASNEIKLSLVYSSNFRKKGGRNKIFSGEWKGCQKSGKNCKYCLSGQARLSACMCGFLLCSLLLSFVLIDESSSSETHCQTKTICLWKPALGCAQILGLSHVFSFDRDVSAICHRLVYLPDLLPRVRAREKQLTPTNAVKLPSAERRPSWGLHNF